MPTDISNKTRLFTESVIREMTRRGAGHGAVNLAQGFPDFPAPAELKEAAKRAIDADSTSTRSRGARRTFRDARSPRRRARYNGIEVRPRTQGHRHLRRDRGDDRDDARRRRSRRRGDHLRAVLRELRPRRDPGRRDAALRDAARAGLGASIPDELAAAFDPRTKAIIVNTPNNPTGKVFTPRRSWR